MSIRNGYVARQKGKGNKEFLIVSAQAKKTEVELAIALTHENGKSEFSPISKEDPCD